MSRKSRRLLVWSLLVLLATWVVGIEPRWVAARELEVAVPEWTGPPGLKVVLAGDWHLTHHALARVMTPERTRRIVDEINAARPDLVLLAGDFVADAGEAEGRATTPAEDVAAELARLHAPLGVFAVLGNHDWWAGGESVAGAFRQRGIRVLENEAVQVDANLWVAGIGDHSTGHSRPRQAVAAVPPRAQALVVMHDPASFAELPAVPGLAFASHTHGGQVVVPFYGPPVLPGDTPREWAYGWVERGSQRMYVTSGLGVSLLPVRFNCRPEWVLFRIGGALG